MVQDKVVGEWLRKHSTHTFVSGLKVRHGNMYKVFWCWDCGDRVEVVISKNEITAPHPTDTVHH